MKRWVPVLIAAAFALPARAETVALAVASNFVTTAETLAAAFEAETGHEVTLSNGATGQLYAQIGLGAPFDVFLSADDIAPARLRDEGLADEVRTYALGRLVIASRVPVTPETAAEAFAGRTVALADPTVAPYGRAATHAMERLKLDTATFRPVLVANVGQVASVFATGNADIAFVAAAQLPDMGATFTLDLDGLVPPVRQDAALLARAQGNPAAQAFWTFLFRPDTAGMIRAAGYGTDPE